MFVRVLNSFQQQQLCAFAERLACSRVEGLWNSALAVSEHATAHTALRPGPESPSRPALHGRGAPDGAESFNGAAVLHKSSFQICIPKYQPISPSLERADILMQSSELSLNPHGGL